MQGVGTNYGYSIQGDTYIRGATIGETGFWKYAKLAWWDPVFGGWVYNGPVSGYGFFDAVDEVGISTSGFTDHEVCDGGDCQEAGTVSW